MDSDGSTRHDPDQASVSVSELLARNREQAAAAHHPAPPAGADGQSLGSSPADTGQLLVTDLLRRERLADEEPQPARPVRSYRLLIAITVLVLAAGVAIASAAVLSGPRTDRAAPVGAALQRIEGPQVLRPDVIIAAVRAPTALGPADAPPAPPRPAPIPQAPQAGPDRAAVAVLTTFYDSAPTAPRQAYELLAEPLRGELAGFERSWADVVDAVVTDVTRVDSGEHVVRVSITNADGTVLRTVQRMRVGDGPDARITAATLLSATHG